LELLESGISHPVTGHGMKGFIQKNIVSLGLLVALVVWGATAGIVYRNTIHLVETAEVNVRQHEVIEANVQKTFLLFFIGNFLSLVLLAWVFYRLNCKIAEQKEVEQALSDEAITLKSFGRLAEEKIR
jgi:hypothetical protein